MQNINTLKPLVLSVIIIGIVTLGLNAKANDAEDPYMKVLESFNFPSSNCDTSAITLPNRPLTGSDINRFTRKFERRKLCEDQLMLADRNALSLVVQRIGGSKEQNNGEFNWTIPQECNCSKEIGNLINQLQSRDQASVSKYQADYYALSQAIAARR
ncbi:MAG: hypothetical protein L3J04_11340 [Robiginitomaculum sp.]|nr:hypothetical protein [Robiginitomaculum sp.]